MVTGAVVGKTQQTSAMIVQGMSKPSGLFIIALLLIPVALLFGFLGLDNIAGYIVFSAFGLMALTVLVFPQLPPVAPKRKGILALVLLIIGVIFGLMFNYNMVV